MGRPAVELPAISTGQPAQSRKRRDADRPVEDLADRVHHPLTRRVHAHHVIGHENGQDEVLEFHGQARHRRGQRNDDRPAEQRAHLREAPAHLPPPGVPPQCDRRVEHHHEVGHHPHRQRRGQPAIERAQHGEHHRQPNDLVAKEPDHPMLHLLQTAQGGGKDHRRTEAKDVDAGEHGAPTRGLDGIGRTGDDDQNYRASRRKTARQRQGDRYVVAGGLLALGDELGEDGAQPHRNHEDDDVHHPHDDRINTEPARTQVRRDQQHGQ